MNQTEPHDLNGFCFSSRCTRTFLLATYLLALSSCTHYYYGPNSSNTPLLSENEAKINAQIAVSDEFSAFELQSAFAVSKHFGGMINFIKGGGDDDNSLYPDGDEGKATYIEAGAGYFTAIRNSPFIFETYGGVGTGGISNNFGAQGRANVVFTKFFAQPNLGIKVKGFEFGLSSRFSYVQHKLKYSTTSNNDVNHLEEHPKSFLWEPGIVLRAGGKNFLVQLQYTASTNITNPDLVQEKGIFNFGFCLPIRYIPKDQ